MQKICQKILLFQKKALLLHPLFANRQLQITNYQCAKRLATVAQLVEQRIRNAWVGGSSPPSGSKRPLLRSFFMPRAHCTFFYLRAYCVSARARAKKCILRPGDYKLNFFSLFSHFFAKKFVYVQNYPYLCTRNVNHSGWNNILHLIYYYLLIYYEKI